MSQTQAESKQTNRTVCLKHRLRASKQDGMSQTQAESKQTGRQVSCVCWGKREGEGGSEWE